METTIIILIYLLSAVVVIILLNKYVRKTKAVNKNVYDALLSQEALENHAMEIARNHTLARNKRSAQWLVQRLNENYKYITEVYKKLNIYVDENKSTVPAAEWLLDNYYIIEQQVKEVRQNISKKSYSQLPTLTEGELKGYPRVYAIALELVAHTDGNFDDKTLVRFIEAYQKQKILSIGEVWALSVMLRMALVENIRRICQKIDKSQKELSKAHELVDFILERMDKPADVLVAMVQEKMKGLEKMHASYAEYILQQLKKEGTDAIPLIQYFDEQLVGQDTTAENIVQYEHQEQAVLQLSMGNSITSFRLLSSLDWAEIFEMISQVEAILRKDPANIYLKMDFESRDDYRNQIVKLARKMKTSEIKVASKSIECATDYAKEHQQKDLECMKRAHVGYYLIDQGKIILKKRIDVIENGWQCMIRPIKMYPGSFYLGSIVTITTLLTIVWIYYAALISGVGVAILTGIIVFIPASDIAISIINWLVTHMVTTQLLPKLALEEGINDKYKTMVVVPTLLPNVGRVKELLGQLEVYYLGNREQNLYFGLVGDFKDGLEEHTLEDDDIINAAMQGVKALNQKYAKEETVFYFFHRHRQYNEKQGKWMGWERKRGALVEFNDLMKGSHNTSYSMISTDSVSLPQIKYIITLDADTQLLSGVAKKLIGTMAHPLNTPIVDEKTSKVVEGYGLLQPRIGVDIESASKTLFSRIFAGQGGIDPYTTAVSDVYQDLFGEGIFTGKGIYDVDVFQQTLKNAIPENAILSHDLLEGSYLRVGLITDIELIDGYPARYNAYMARLHRWVRGDWQLMPWLGGKVRNRQGEKVKNPLSIISKWKIVDNLRRSLLAPSLVGIFLLAFCQYVTNSLPWVLFGLAALGFTLITSSIDAVIAKNYRFYNEKCNATIICGVKAVFYQVSLMLMFLPYHAYMMVDAVSRTLFRLIFSKKNMLEWVTAADVEKRLKNDIRSFWRRMWVCAVLGIFILVLALVGRVYAWWIAGIILVIWSAAPFIAYRISIVDDIKLPALSIEDIRLLKRLARKMWRYFEDFVGPRDHYLPPDNYQENPPNGIAHRTSPTNIGLLLLSVLAARDFGYIGLSDMMQRLDNTISTVEKMKKWKGQLYNWYDTRTLEGLRPLYISTVDSGNFIGYLMTVHQGLAEYLKKPIIDCALIEGLKDTILLAQETEKFDMDISVLAHVNDKESISLIAWKEQLEKLTADLETHRNTSDSWWKYKLSAMFKEFKDDILFFAAWVDVYEKKPACKYVDPEVVSKVEKILQTVEKQFALHTLEALYHNARNDIKKLEEGLKHRKERKCQEMQNWLLNLIEAIQKSQQHISITKERYEKLMNRIAHIIDHTQFAPLFDERRQLFSIGYNLEEEKLTKSYYDLLASEARQTSFIAIAKGEIDQKHWFRLGRNLTKEDGYKGLVSWTGTMFEYLMPLLIMRNYKNTLWDETYWFVVKSQKKYGKQRKVPWGTSESGYYSFDINLNYQYKALGVPGLGLKRGLINDMVVAPYATVMAIMVDALGTMKNIKRLQDEGLDGSYGLYEAIDYTPQRLPKNQKSGIVKSFMVHHQGMSLVALNNYLYDNVMQNRFHANPLIKSAAFLLQERVPKNVLITNENREKVRPLKPITQVYEDYMREVGMPRSKIPHVHILSNNAYATMITDSGIGYSKKYGILMTRWREYSVFKQYGMFFYIRNVEKNEIWSATYAPLNYKPEQYRVRFLADRAQYFRRDGEIDTTMEVTVSPEDNVDIRRITLINHGDQAVTLDITSYLEAVLTSQSADLAHPAFSNLFVRTEFVQEHQCLIANRRLREEDSSEIWALHTVFLEGESVGGVQYETDRAKFIGRGRGISNPVAVESDHPLSNTVGAVLDPVMSLRARIVVQAGEKASVIFTTGICDNREQVLEVAKRYQQSINVMRAAELAYTRSQVEARYLGLKSSERKIYDDMIANILFHSPLRKNIKAHIKHNQFGQTKLWEYGISGDIPIVMIMIYKNDEVELVKQMLKAHEYWKMKGVTVDLVIINEDEGSYTQPLQDAIRDTVSASHARDMQDQPGGVFIRAGKTIPQTDKELLLAAARIVIRGDGGTLGTQIQVNDTKKALPSIKKEQSTIQYDKIKQPQLENLMFDNGWGGFTKDGKEYVIYLKEEQHTPLPWVNVIANNRFGFLVTESGGGYTWSQNSRENKLTVWSNDAITDHASEAIYLRDEETAKVWTVTPLPIREKSLYVIRHGFGYTTFIHASNGISQQLTMFVAKQEPVKVQLLKVKNETQKRRKLSATYYIRPVLGANDQLTAPYLISEIDDETEAMLFHNHFNVDFEGRIAFMDVSEKARSYTGDIQEFIGDEGDVANPEGLKRVKLSNTVGAGYDPCGAMQAKITLAPGEEKEIVFILGQTKDRSEIKYLCDKYKEVSQGHNALAEAKAFWKDLLNVVTVKTPDLSMNYMLNGWLLYQTLSCRIWGRSAFYQSGGAYGFRDQLQDVMAVVHAMPETVYRQVLKHAKHQFVEGDVQHWWHPVDNKPEGYGDKGVRTKFSDDFVWLVFVIADYIENTGDYEILTQEAGYLEDELLGAEEDERYTIPRLSSEQSSVYEHCIRVLERALKFGERGIPLMGSGDWNDGMNKVGNKGKGESVWLGWFIYDTLQRFIPICRHQKDEDRAVQYEKIAQEMIKNIEKNAWDGRWYRRAYFDDGTPMGSAQNTECKIDSLAQSWAVISEAGDKMRIKEAMAALEHHLIKREDGIIMLLTPPFDKGNLHPGYIKGYVPGVRENGGQYTHAAIWVIYAFAKMGEGDKAWQLYNMINPINHARTSIEAARYKVEPYVMAADVYAVHPNIGRGGWTWYTGAAGWMYRVGLEHILGFKKRGEHLMIDPCIPKAWAEYTITYRNGGTPHQIIVKNPNNISKGIKKIVMDGKQIKGNSICLSTDGKKHQIEVIMGESRNI